MPNSPIQRAERLVERARRDLDAALEQLAAAIAGQEETPTRPSVPDAVMAVMRDARADLDTSAIYEAMAKRDALPGGAEVMKSLRVTLGRLVKRGQLVRVRDGVYRLPTKSSDRPRASRS